MKKFEENLASRVSGVLQPMLGVQVTVTASNGLLATLYDDDELTVLGNPLTTDANGYFGFKAANGEYTLTFAGAQIEAATRKIELYDADDDPPLTLAQAALPTAASRFGFQIAGEGSVSRTIENKLRDIVIGARDFGAVGDGIADDTNALQRAVDTLTGTGIPLQLEAGCTFLVKSDRGIRVTGDIAIHGAGASVSAIKYDNYAAGPAMPVFYTDSAIPANAGLSLDGFAIVGSWGENADFSETNSLISVFNFNRASFTRLHLKGSRSGGIVAGNLEYFLVDGCIFENMYRDSCRCANSKRAIVTNNFFKNILDDCVSVYNSDASNVIDNSIIITGNNIVDSQGILAGGGKVVTIADNHIVRPFHRAIHVGQTRAVFETGNAPVISINIHDNTIVDGFNGLVFSPLQGAGFKAIHIEGAALVAKDVVEWGNPVIAPYPYMYLNNTDDSGQPNAGMYNISVHDNTITRTLKETAAYSNYGFGQRLSRSGWVNPAIALSDLMECGIEVTSSGNGVSIDSNKIDGCKDCLIIEPGAAVNGVAARNYRVVGNTFRSWRASAITMAFNGLLEVARNIFDGDPYHESAYRTANGGWDATNFRLHRAVSVNTATSNVSLNFHDNTIKNVGVPLYNTVTSSPNYEGMTFRGNLLVCDPFTTGHHADNRGIGFTPRANQLDARVVIEDCNPASSTFKRVLNVPVTFSSTLPTSGKYLAGCFVTCTDGSATYGWKRITTGTGHVLGTDWIAV
ncbi:glycosyl hydrolase family 28-related protein [Massilia timonae]|uniref:glycosyl hydrolase family 28-related protein n=1 Tax=Massilia timonae TaxID=47229 RepID=UPI00289CBF7E|nr:glycosyl hydrolase family 28-related protein [Massilia timonae]